VAFQASLAGPGGNTGIWFEGPDGLELLVRTGQQFEVAPGDIRTIQQLGFYGGSGNEDGARSGFNDFDQLAFSASFTDGTSGVFVANLGTIPEPASAALVLVAAGVFYSRARRR
jgi:hypothetical protein